MERNFPSLLSLRRKSNKEGENKGDMTAAADEDALVEEFKL